MGLLKNWGEGTSQKLSYTTPFIMVEDDLVSPRRGGHKVVLYLPIEIPVQVEDDIVSPRAGRAAFTGMRGRRAPFNGMRGKRGQDQQMDYDVSLFH